MGNAVYFSFKKLANTSVKQLKEGIYEGRIIKLTNNPKAYSVQLRNGFVVNNVIGEEGLTKYTNVVIVTYGSGKNRASIIKSEKVIEYTVPEYTVI